jgi:hypothetical protein
MITGLPDYKPPIEQGVRCRCLRYYVVFTGAGMIESSGAGIRPPHLSLQAAELRARDRASEMHALFVDARETQFMICDCGEVLDFTPEYSESEAVPMVQ